MHQIYAGANVGCGNNAASATFNTEQHILRKMPQQEVDDKICASTELVESVMVDAQAETAAHDGVPYHSGTEMDNTSDGTSDERVMERMEELQLELRHLDGQVRGTSGEERTVTLQAHFASLTRVWSRFLRRGYTAHAFSRWKDIGRTSHMPTGHVC